MLSGVLAVLQASMFDGLSLDPFSSLDDGCGSAEVSIGVCHVCPLLPWPNYRELPAAAPYNRNSIYVMLEKRAFQIPLEL
jgi:hypothetical protein